MEEILTPETELEVITTGEPDETTVPGDIVKAKVSFTTSSKKALDYITNQHENAGWDIERIITDDKVSKDGDVKITYKATLAKEFLVTRDGGIESYEDALGSGDDEARENSNPYGDE
jgi:hypothetical protein